MTFTRFKHVCIQLLGFPFAFKAPPRERYPGKLTLPLRSIYFLKEWAQGVLHRSRIWCPSSGAVAGEPSNWFPSNRKSNLFDRVLAYLAFQCSCIQVSFPLVFHSSYQFLFSIFCIPIYICIPYSFIHSFFQCLIPTLIVVYDQERSREIGEPSTG